MGGTKTRLQTMECDGGSSAIAFAAKVPILEHTCVLKEMMMIRPAGRNWLEETVPGYFGVSSRVVRGVSHRSSRW